MAETKIADVVYFNGRFATLDAARPEASAVAIADGRFLAVGDDAQISGFTGANTKRIDLKKHRVVPGLNDSHLHVIRGGLNFNMELRWDGVPSLADALRMLREQAARTPPPQWVRVVGGWSEFQFAERRMPTIDELNEAAPDTPVFVLHLYDRALLNGAALRAVGYDEHTPAPPGGEIEHDMEGNPTGLLLAKPNAMILYATLAKGPRLDSADQKNSTRHFMRELNRLGLTSVIDAGGGFQNYPQDYQVIEELHRDDEMTLRIAYNLFTQKPKEELSDFANWAKMVTPGQGDDLYRHNGAGEMLVFSAADFEDFLQPRPELPSGMEGELERVIRLLAENKWPFRLHATYDESIGRALDVFEKVHADVPLTGLNWFFDHAETVTPRNIDRIAKLGGGIAIQDRMAFQGEYFVDRYGAEKAEETPPVLRMLEAGVPVGLGTDATRVSSFNPWVALYWLTTGKTVGGLRLYSERKRVDRTTALRLFTEGSAWFSTEAGKKGAIKAGQLADFAVLSDDYFSVPEEEIKSIVSVMTVLGGKPVYAAEEFAHFSPPLPPASPSWSPVRAYGGYQSKRDAKSRAFSRMIAAACGCANLCGVHGHAHDVALASAAPTRDLQSFWGVLGCSCFAF